MSETIAGPGRYEVLYSVETEREDAGVIDVAADGRLTIVSALPRFADAMALIVRNMNALPAKSVRTEPPPGAPRYSLWSRKVQRDSPEFIGVMLEDLKGYGFELIPEPSS